MRHPRFTTIIIHLLYLLIILLGIGVSDSWAKDIMPVGEKVAVDAQGHDIYQTSAN